jgi:aldehyde:ferredoxin oxidoreductase
MNGYTGRILYIDLTQQKFIIENFDEAFARKFLGGNGFAIKILYDGLKKGIDPFSPENLVVFAVGPVTDSPLPSTSRAYVATKSPLNGLFFDSTFGGRFAITQKRTGFEAIVISGKAASPIYLVIDESDAQFKPAGSLWGKLTKETFEAIQAAEGEPADAEGSFRLAERLGKDSANLLYCFKKVEVAGHSARALKGMSLGYATATRGGSHHDARLTLQYAGEFDRTKAQIAPTFAFLTQNFTAMNDSLTQCRFASERGFGGVINENYVKMINSITGWNFTLADVEGIGERIYNLERAFNCREGVSRKDDALPFRTSRQPIPDGPSKGMHTPPDEFKGMLEEYYRLRGWDTNGIPTGEKLMALDLPEAARELG